MKILTIAAISGLALLTGCATSYEACDPYNRDASLITKLSCDASGGYRAHIDAGEQQVELDRQENALFRKIHRQISEQQRATRNELRVTNQEQYELERDIEELVARLGRRSQEHQGLQHQLDDLERQMSAEPAPSASDEETLSERHARLEALQQQVDRLQQSLGYSP